MTRLILTAAIAALLVACSGPASEAPAPTTVAPVATTATALKPDTRLAAVLVYADWCSSCKILDPKLTEAKADGPIDGLEYIVLDYTDRDDDNFFSTADTLGLGAPIREELSGSIKTGILLLVDVDDGKIVGDLRKELSPADIRSAMIEAAASA